MCTPEKSDSQKVDKNVIDIDPVTVVAILLALLFIPLVLSGFISH